MGWLVFSDFLIIIPAVVIVAIGVVILGRLQKKETDEEFQDRQW